jgi:hypothetical protein
MLKRPLKGEPRVRACAVSGNPGILRVARNHGAGQYLAWLVVEEVIHRELRECSY